MPKRKLILLAVALLIAGMTVIMARSMINGANKNDGAGQQAAATTQVLVAARDMPSGTLIKETDLKWQVWPTEGATDGFAVKGKNETSEYVGAVVRQGMRSGEPVMTGRVMRVKEQGFMAAVLNPGMRAVSISITPVAGVAGFVFPGDHVDVIVTHQVGRKSDNDPEPRKVSETVLVDVRVLALDQKSDDQITEPKIAQTATLEVSPKQAEKLALVTELGTLSLALRSIASDQTATTVSEGNTASQQSLAAAGDNSHTESMTWDSDVSRVLAKPANRNGIVQHVQILRGKEVTESIFDIRQ